MRVFKKAKQRVYEKDFQRNLALKSRSSRIFYIAVTPFSKLFSVPSLFLLLVIQGIPDGSETLN
jgi:hypothetical protein